MKPNVPANNNLVVFANDNLSRITLMCSDHLTTLAAYKLPALQSRDFHHPGKKKSDQVDKIYLLRRLPSLLQNKGFWLTFEWISLIVHHRNVSEEGEAVEQVVERRHLLLNDLVDAAIALLVEGEEVERQRDFPIKRVVAILNVWEQSLAEPEYFCQDHLLTLFPTWESAGSYKNRQDLRASNEAKPFSRRREMRRSSEGMLGGCKPCQQVF